MSPLHQQKPGHLLYTGPLYGHSHGLIAGEAATWAVHVIHSGHSTPPYLNVQFDLYGGYTMYGTDDGQMAEEDALAAFQQIPTTDIRALLQLARNHPDEYEDLRETEAVLRALGGD
jgi:hypothetical protein